MMDPLVQWLSAPPNYQPGKTHATTHTYWLFFMGNVPGHFTKYSCFVEFWVGSDTICLHKGLDLSRSSIFTLNLTLFLCISTCLLKLIIPLVCLYIKKYFLQFGTLQSRVFITIIIVFHYLIPGQPTLIVFRSSFSLLYWLFCWLLWGVLLEGKTSAS
jgi:hypothetical protein